MLTMVIIAGEIDLSPASTMALTACLFAWVLQAGLPMPLAVIVCLGSGFVLGLFNAVLVIGLKLPSLIVTIGTLILYRGLAQVLAGDASIRLPDWYRGIDRVLWLGLPVPVADLRPRLDRAGGRARRHHLRPADLPGRHQRGCGTARRHPRPAHQDDALRRHGLVAALAGMIYTSRLGTVRYDLGVGGELQMVLMAMLGGTYIFGGRGSILGTFLAAWLLSIITTGMTTANWLPATQFCVLGVLLIVSIVATNFIYSRTQR